VFLKGGGHSPGAAQFHLAVMMPRLQDESVRGVR